MSRCCGCRNRFYSYAAPETTQVQGNSNVNLTIDNTTVLVSVLVAVGVLTGALEPEALRTLVDQLRTGGTTQIQA